VIKSRNVCYFAVVTRHAVVIMQTLNWTNQCPLFMTVRHIFEISLDFAKLSFPRRRLGDKSYSCITHTRVCNSILLTACCVYKAILIKFTLNNIYTYIYTIQGVSKKTLRKFNRLLCIINVAKQFDFYIGRKSCYLAFLTPF
jgi:hypothetical protein